MRGRAVGGYLIVSDQGVLGAMGFGAAAWKVHSRDAWIGRDQAQRPSRLHRIVNHTRFLILPWVRCANLGSRVLAPAARRGEADFRTRYVYAPVLLERFVQSDRFKGTVYRPANWQCVGSTRGRGRNSRSHAPPVELRGADFARCWDAFGPPASDPE